MLYFTSFSPLHKINNLLLGTKQEHKYYEYNKNCTQKYRGMYKNSFKYRNPKGPVFLYFTE